MEFFVDIADLEQIKKVAEYYPIQGFTTNPKLLARTVSPVQELMPEYRKLSSEQNLTVFFQVTGKTAEEMFVQAKALKEYFGDQAVVKIPAIKEGFKAVGMCKKEGIRVCVTVIHSTMQALMAAHAGAEYAAPYVSHMDNTGADGVKCVEEMVKAFAYGGYPCKVLGASFRTVDQIKKLAVAGCHAVTIVPEMFDTLIAHPSTNISMSGFEQAWEEKFQNTHIHELLP